MPDARLPSWSTVAVLACAVATAGCQLFVDLEGLEDRSCPPGHKACNDQCVSERDIATGCGDPGCDPCGPAHANAACDKNNHCSFTTCIAPWDACDTFEDNGCETDLDHTPMHCGACHHECPEPLHGKAGCSGGACIIGECTDGWEDCDLDPSNGCEHPIWTDLECVSCGVPCPEGSSCDEGICRAPATDGGAG
jgi:hypothetical protein